MVSLMDLCLSGWGYGPAFPLLPRGDFFDFEVGGHDGACKGRIHVIVPFIGRKNGSFFYLLNRINLFWG